VCSRFSPSIDHRGGGVPGGENRFPIPSLFFSPYCTIVINRHSILLQPAILTDREERSMTRSLFAPTARSITTLDPKVYILLQRGTHQKQKTKEMACLALSLLQVPRASGRSGVTRRLDMTQTFLRLDLPWTNSYEPFQCPRASLVEKRESLMTFQKNGCVGGSVMTRSHSGSVSPQHFHTVHLGRSIPRH
jgi:hypothetical protein